MEPKLIIGIAMVVLIIGGLAALTIHNKRK